MILRAGSEAAAGSSHESPRDCDKRSRKRRLQLSCGECRKKKLSCDRNWPCQRCIRSGRQDQCSYETLRAKATVTPDAAPAQLQQVQSETGDEVLRLRTEVAQLKDLLSRPQLQTETGCSVGPNDEAGAALPTPPTVDSYGTSGDSSSLVNSVSPPDHPNNRATRGYYAQHSLFRFFVEIPHLFPFIIETADEWLKPAGVHLKKTKPERSGNGWNEILPLQEISRPLDALLPPKDDTDALVAFYLDNLEQLHRLVHVPTFKRQYSAFWLPGQPRSPAVAALTLSMIAISACASGTSGDCAPVAAKYRTMPAPWIFACDKWLSQQSPKYNKLLQYQVACLGYLAKRMNMVHKKRFWTETGGLVQKAMIDGLHRPLSPTTDSPFMVEMRCRIWHVIRELDLQNSYEYGLPTLLHNIDSDVTAPTNVHDDEFGEASAEMPFSKSTDHYTRSSYQSVSVRSWDLRLEISRRLHSPALSRPLTYDDVLRYTHEVTQAVAELPNWDSAVTTGDFHGARPMPVLANAFLQFQLKECIIALHRPYLQRDKSKFWLSENICHHMSRDILLIHRQLADQGIQSLAQLREDLLLASLSLTRIITLQPPSSTDMIMSSSESTLQLMEQCLPILEDRYLRCWNSEPWCFITMCATFVLLKVHLGKESRQTAKYSCGQKFLDLHYRYLGRQQTDHQQQQQQQQQPLHGNALLSPGETLASGPTHPYPSTIFDQVAEWADCDVFNFGLDSFDFDMSMWGGT